MKCLKFSLLLQSLFVVFLSMMIITGCKKSDKPIIISNEFNIDNAKEWWYGTFKKSPEWTSSSLHGKKLPDWKHGLYRKIGNMEIIEFPLVKERKSVSIPSEPSLTIADTKRIAEASLTRVVFIKNADKTITLREIDYIPDWEYLQKKSFDINDASLAKPLSDFSGKLTVKKWNGGVVSLKILAAGRVIKNGKIKSPAINMVSRQTKTSSGEGCTNTQYCVWQSDCELIIYGDGMVINECGEWYNTGECWIEEYCPDPCEGMNEEQCACQIYGNCGGGDEEEEDYTCANTQRANFEQTVAASVSVSTDLSGSSTEVDPLTRNVSRDWYCLDGFGGWKLISHETGVIKYVLFNANYRWEWESIAHNSITKDGSTLPGVSVSFSQGVGTPHTSILYASMALSFNVTYSFLCDCPWFPPSWLITPEDKNYNSNSPFWLANP